MADWNWQIAAVLLILTGALVVLARRAFRLWKGKSAGCGTGGCEECPVQDASGARQKPFVPLDNLTNTAAERRPGKHGP